MIEFVYNNAKNANTEHISFQFKYHYYPYILFVNDINLYLKSRLASKLAKELMLIYPDNLFYAQKL